MCSQLQACCPRQRRRPVPAGGARPERRRQRPPAPAMAAEPASQFPPPSLEPEEGSFGYDPLVLALPEPFQRLAVGQLHRALIQRGEGGEEEAQGLFGDSSSLIRYLEANCWDVAAAEAKMRSTARWRHSFGVAALLAGTGGVRSQLAAEGATGKLYVRGFDRLGQAVLYIKPGRENTFDMNGVLRLLVYCLERAATCAARFAALRRAEAEERGSLLGSSAACRPLQQVVVMLVLFDGYSLTKGVPLRLLREALTILQDHYPGRVGEIFLVQPPWLLAASWRLFASLPVAPWARSRLQLVRGSAGERRQRLERSFDVATLEACAGGSKHAPFSMEVFLGSDDGTGSALELGLDFDDQAAAGAHSWSDEMAQDMRLRCLAPHEDLAIVMALAQALASPGGHGSEVGHGLFDDVGMLIRVLRARNWDLEAAEAMIRATAKWRQDFGVSAVVRGECEEVIAAEIATGKMYLRGKDLQGRPILYMRPRCENTYNHHGSLQLLVYCMERACSYIERRWRQELEAVPDGSPAAAMQAEGCDGKLVVIADFAACSLLQHISMRTTIDTLTIVQDHYPERLGQAFIMDPPWGFSSFWQAVSPFIDPVTSQKIQFVSEQGPARTERLAKFFDLTEVEAAVGGLDERPFLPEVFLQAEVEGMVFGVEYCAQLAAASGAVASSDGAATAAAGPESPRRSIESSSGCDDAGQLCRQPGGQRAVPFDEADAFLLAEEEEDVVLAAPAAAAGASDGAAAGSMSSVSLHAAAVGWWDHVIGTPRRE